MFIRFELSVLCVGDGGGVVDIDGVVVDDIDGGGVVVVKEGVLLMVLVVLL